MSGPRPRGPLRRAPTIAVKEREFIEAGRALGYSDMRLMLGPATAPAALSEACAITSFGSSDKFHAPNCQTW